MASLKRVDHALLSAVAGRIANRIGHLSQPAEIDGATMNSRICPILVIFNAWQKPWNVSSNCPTGERRTCAGHDRLAHCARVGRQEEATTLTPCPSFLASHVISFSYEGVKETIN
jgi:hypothetical protein